MHTLLVLDLLHDSNDPGLIAVVFLQHAVDKAEINLYQINHPFHTSFSLLHFNALLSLIISKNYFSVKNSLKFVNSKPPEHFFGKKQNNTQMYNILKCYLDNLTMKISSFIAVLLKIAANRGQNHAFARLKKLTANFPGNA